jgi:hypothetical protein
MKISLRVFELTSDELAPIGFRNHCKRCNPECKPSPNCVVGTERMPSSRRSDAAALMS